MLLPAHSQEGQEGSERVELHQDHGDCAAEEKWRIVNEPWQSQDCPATSAYGAEEEEKEVEKAPFIEQQWRHANAAHAPALETREAQRKTKRAPYQSGARFSSPKR